MMNTTNRIARWMIVGCICAACWGCLRTDAPLVEVEQAIDPAQLIGTWNLVQPGGDKNQTTIDFRPAAKGLPDHSLKLVITTYKKDQTLDRDSAWCYIGKLGDDAYLHTWTYGSKPEREEQEEFDLEAWKKAADRQITISWLQIEGDQLKLHVADGQKVFQLLSKDINSKLDADEVAKIRERLLAEGADSLFKTNDTLTFAKQD